MKTLAGGLTFVNAAVTGALLLGIVCHGLSPRIAVFSFLVALLLAGVAWLQTTDTREVRGEEQRDSVSARPRYRIWLWFVAACFAFFAFRSFCWVLYSDGSPLKIQSPNNLGDLALHITYIKNFANGVPLWPDNPIYLGSKMRYPAGTDLFNGLLLLGGVSLIHGLVWAGLLGSLATFYALYRWGGSFGVAGFLFNGGLAGMQIVHTWKWIDYEAPQHVAWKSLPLAMFVTQRGLLYALPAGLLLLYQWRAKYFATRQSSETETRPRGPLPFWVELTLYATMPLFHVHTFMALSIAAAFFFAVGDRAVRTQLGTLVAVAFLPATFFIWTITDQFHARSILQWKPGWVQIGTGEMAMPFFRFWIYNFGALVPLMVLLLAVLIDRVWQSVASKDPAREEQSSRGAKHSLVTILHAFRGSAALSFLFSAALIFIFALLVKTAPWEWDNLKLIIWAYLMMLPFLWSELIGRWPSPVRAGVCVTLFASGFVSLFGGLVTNPDGHTFADRAELDAVGPALRPLPLDARFAAFPTYNHPLLLEGRKAVLGYPGHLWTQGFDYAPTEAKLTTLMRGTGNWRQTARDLQARYVFWGREEATNYPTSSRPWERETQLVASGDWGSVYDLESHSGPQPVTE